MVEHPTTNREAAGSSPAMVDFSGRIFFIMVKIKCNYYADVMTPQIERQLDDLKISIGTEFF
jgi:hypothetical protein